MKSFAFASTKSRNCFGAGILYAIEGMRWSEVKTKREHAELIICAWSMISLWMTSNSLLMIRVPIRLFRAVYQNIHFQHL